MIELQPLRPVNRHDLHRVVCGGLWLREQLGEERPHVARPAPLSRGGAITQCAQESARVAQILFGISIGRAETQPYRLEPIGKRKAVTRLQRSRQNLPDSRQVFELVRRDVFEALRVADGFKHDELVTSVRERGQGLQRQPTPRRPKHREPCGSIAQVMQGL